MKRWLRRERVQTIAGAVLGLIGGIAVGEILVIYFGH